MKTAILGFLLAFTLVSGTIVTTATGQKATAGVSFFQTLSPALAHGMSPA